MQLYEFRQLLEALASRSAPLTMDEKASLFRTWLAIRPQAAADYRSVIEARLRGLGVMQ